MFPFCIWLQYYPWGEWLGYGTVFYLARSHNPMRHHWTLLFCSWVSKNNSKLTALYCALLTTSEYKHLIWDTKSNYLLLCESLESSKFTATATGLAFATNSRPQITWIQSTDEYLKKKKLWVSNSLCIQRQTTCTSNVKKLLFNVLASKRNKYSCCLVTCLLFFPPNSI